MINCPNRRRNERRPFHYSRRPGQLEAYGKAVERLDEPARHVDVLIPGNGAIAQGPEIAARFAADRAYLDALRQGEEPVDARWGPRALGGEQFEQRWDCSSNEL